MEIIGIHPSMIFTYNSSFKLSVATTPEKKQKLDTLLEYLEHYGIVCVGIDSNETRTYVKESPDILHTFFQRNKIGKKTVVMSHPK